MVIYLIGEVLDYLTVLTDLIFDTEYIPRVTSLDENSTL